MNHHLVDLTLRLHEQMPALPAHGRNPVHLSGTHTHQSYAETARRNPYNGDRVSFVNDFWLINGHSGTHMDAIWHADSESAQTIDAMPLAYGFGPAVWLDCSAATERDGSITADDLDAAAGSGALEPGDIVLLHTGWSRVADEDPQRYVQRLVGLSRSGAEWLRDKRVRTVGLDSVSVESPDTVEFATVHTNFLKPHVLSAEVGYREPIGIIENLTGVDRIPAHRFLFCGLPLPFADGTGSPIRAVAAVAPESS
ncbi:cyclase family protein [Amycolatopsis pithecellobii]|uniref:Cyclase family protein n=1 Tax=Amycolatopsis pithecellobii TaxID=664692 RepID=A0A6N7Z079_9PSEU|nr:cyclase family protein [Amycolatopsis pithecellobii]MTD54663.1 cyclase family protein [Amycolatopsis pithecellobii]